MPFPRNDFFAFKTSHRWGGNSADSLVPAPSSSARRLRLAPNDDSRSTKTTATSTNGDSAPVMLVLWSASHTTHKKTTNIATYRQHSLGINPSILGNKRSDTPRFLEIYVLTPPDSWNDRGNVPTPDEDAAGKVVNYFFAGGVIIASLAISASTSLASKSSSEDWEDSYNRLQAATLLALAQVFVKKCPPYFCRPLYSEEEDNMSAVSRHMISASMDGGVEDIVVTFLSAIDLLRPQQESFYAYATPSTRTILSTSFTKVKKTPTHDRPLLGPHIRYMDSLPNAKHAHLRKERTD